MSVTAVSWGPWRAEYRAGAIAIRGHRERGKPLPVASMVPLEELDGEDGLRAAIWRHARASGLHLTLLTDADQRWVERLTEDER